MQCANISTVDSSDTKLNSLETLFDSIEIISFALISTVYFFLMKLTVKFRGKKVACLAVCKFDTIQEPALMIFNR